MMTTNATNIVRRKVDAIGTCACVDLVHEALVFTHRKLAGACWTAKGRPEAEACSAIVADAIATLATLAEQPGTRGRRCAGSISPNACACTARTRAGVRDVLDAARERLDLVEQGDRHA